MRDGFSDRLAVKEPPAGEHLEENGARGEQIASKIDRVAGHLLDHAREVDERGVAVAVARAGPEPELHVRQHRHELDRRLSEWTATQDDKQLMRSLQARGVCAGAALTAADLAHDPHLVARGFLQEIERAGGRRAYAGRPFRIPGIPMAIRHTASLGEHNEAVLREVAGLSPDEIRKLAEQGVIADRPRAKPTYASCRRSGDQLGDISRSREGAPVTGFSPSAAVAPGGAPSPTTCAPGSPPSAA